MIGKTLAHYKVVEKIGAGGMGEVYRATDSKLGRDVALKILPEAFAKDPERMARFQREAQLLAQLNHANIAAIYGIETRDGSAALVLELVAGPTLEDRIRSGPLPAGEALPIARQMAEAIESAHEAGIIHRDLKPANVKITPEGNVKVLDFGLARAFTGDPLASASGATVHSPGTSPALTSPVITGALTGANVILGTAAYMSPEQARAKPVDKRCDIWSFGVVLFEMLTGRPLFAGETVSDTLASVLRSDPDWDRLPADLPSPIRRLLRRCLERDPRKRLRDIGDARIAIEEVLEGRADTAGEPSPTAPTRGGRKGERLAWLGALLAAIALGLWGRFGGADSGDAVADWRLSIARDEEAASGSFLAISPDGSTVAFLGSAGIRLRRLDRLEPVLLKDTEGADMPFWSPDGRSLGFYQDGKLKRIALDTGFVERIADMPNPRAPGTWLEGDRILFSPNFSDGMMVVPASGDSPPLPAAEKEADLGLTGGHQWAAPLPDGNRFLFVERDYEGNAASIRVGSLDSLGTRALLPRRPVSIRGLTVLGDNVLYIRDSVLLAHPFDPKRAEFTGEPRVLLNGAKVESFCVSRSGVLAWVAAQDQSEAQARLTWLDRNGTALETLRDLPDNAMDPRLSPDGRRFLFTAESKNLENDRALFAYDLVRASFRRLVSSGSLIGSWSPDGKRVTYLGSDGKLWITDATGTGSPGRGLADLPGEAAREVPLDWSSDGRHIAFCKVLGSRIGTWILPVGEGEPFPYADGAGEKYYASFAPNGKWIAYTSDESGRTEVYVDSFPTRRARTQVSTKGGVLPRWRRDGRELFFAGGDEQSRFVEFNAVDVEEADGRLTIGTPAPLFEASTVAFNMFYDVSADGQRFLLPIRPELPPRPVHVVSDWKRARKD